MRLFTRKKREKILAAAERSAGEKARDLYRAGDNCAQAVLQATCTGVSEELVAVADVFGGGIADSKCLCGAIAGGAMSLSLQGQGKKAALLIEQFKARNRTTCCKGLTARFAWLSREHIDNCREMTADTADLVEQLLKD